MSLVRKARLPNDVIGILEDRISDDPLDFPAYEELLSQLRNKSKIDEARQVFEQLLKVLPASAYVWRQYAEMEASENELNRVEVIFSRALMASLNLDIWNYYLDYIRRTHPLSTGGSTARTVVSQAYEFVLQHVGIDIGSGPIWSDYISFLKTAPATSSWEEQQRNDQLRKTYQRAVVVPLENVELLWREYNAFENGINRQTARKFINEKSPAYMTCRAVAKELSSIISPLRSTKFPSRTTRSPSDEHYVSGWRRWLALEKADPLELDDQAQVRTRVKYAYKQCLMYCRFYPEVWYDAATYFESLNESETVQDGTHTQPSATLKEGLEANPKSWLLSFAYAEFEEHAQRNDNVKKTFEALISSNQEEITKLEKEYQLKVDAVQQSEASEVEQPKLNGAASDSDSDDETSLAQPTKSSARLLESVKRIEEEKQEKLKELSEEGTVAAIMYMRALRRMEGIKAARQVFAKSIGSTHMSWQIYVASALMEHQYNEMKATEKDGKQPTPIAVKIFTRGMKHFSENVNFVLEYLDFLLNIRDDTNARALFEQTTAKLDPVEARPLFSRWYEYESMYGDLTSAQKLATRMAEIDKASNSLTLFGQRFSYLGCDPIARRDLGMRRLPAKPVVPGMPHPLPPHPLGFPPLPGPGAPPIPSLGGFNPPLVAQFQRNDSPLPPVLPPPPPPIHPSLINLIRDLPPSGSLDKSITFNHSEILQLVRNLDMARAQPAPGTSGSRQGTPQAIIQPIVPSKRGAVSQVIPDDLVALGRHNDPRDIYKKRG